MGRSKTAPGDPKKEGKIGSHNVAYCLEVKDVWPSSKEWLVMILVESVNNVTIEM